MNEIDLINNGISDEISSNFLGLGNNSKVIRNPFLRIMVRRGQESGESLQIPDILLHSLGSLLLRHCKDNMVHSVIVHINLKTNLIPSWNNHVIDPSNEIMAALKLQSGQQTLTIPSPTGVELESGLTLFQQQRRIVPAITYP
ncbi:hypothetical protein Lal_00043902 [Lupinus albus]|nr:hypothetical protein Lal_00043902 [Lupinus albus]